VSFIFNRDFLDFLKILNHQEAEYLIVGGYSVILHGYNRTTGDLDIWVNRTENNYEKISRAFQEFGMPVFDMTSVNFMDINEFDVFTFGRPPLAIDIMTQVKGLNFMDCFNKRIIYEIDNISINIIGKDDLIKAKLASNRARDIDDIEHLD
jgi:hypothetical protein